MLNQRLNILGVLDISKYGAHYAQSGNAGMFDIVAALQWVRGNVFIFGGDPDCVTIIGQSGGGAKVGTLMGMLTAQGLFHRAIVQSGFFLPSNTKKNCIGWQIWYQLNSVSTAAISRGFRRSPLRRASGVVLAKANPQLEITQMLTMRR